MTTTKSNLTSTSTSSALTPAICTSARAAAVTSGRPARVLGVCRNMEQGKDLAWRVYRWIRPRRRATGSPPGSPPQVRDRARPGRRLGAQREGGPLVRALRTGGGAMAHAGPRPEGTRGHDGGRDHRLHVVPGLRLLGSRHEPPRAGREDPRRTGLARQRRVHRAGAARTRVRRGDDRHAAERHRRDDGTAEPSPQRGGTGRTDRDRGGREPAVADQLRARAHRAGLQGPV